MKIFITGNAAAGKTTFSKKLSDELDVPMQSMDRFVWLPGWKRQKPEKIKEALSYEVIKSDWIIEGVSSYVMQHADIIIFLDVPIYKAYWRAIKRTFRHLWKQRPEMPENCSEVKNIKELFKIIWNFHFQVRKTMLEKVWGYQSEKKIFYFDKIPSSIDLIYQLSKQD
jgi:adenylate kinase family enzyme